MWSATLTESPPIGAHHHVWRWDHLASGKPVFTSAGDHFPVARIRCGRCSMTRWVSKGYAERIASGGRFA